MPAAGETIIAGRIPGERIATSIVTTNSGSVTSEVVIDTVVAPVVAGRTYRVRWIADVQSTVTDNVVRCRIREDSLTGNVLQLINVRCTSGRDIGFIIEGEYTADATEDKTFAGTAFRQDGVGTIALNANANEPAYLYVDYLRG
jgi:hypothetical protein